MSNLKDLRKQLRNIVQELFPEIVSKEQYVALNKKIDDKLAEIQKQVTKTLEEMNGRHKDSMGYLIRQASTYATKGSNNEQK